MEFITKTLVIFCISSISAFTTVRDGRSHSYRIELSLNAEQISNELSLSRRSAVQSIFSTFGLLSSSSVLPISAANAGLLDDYGSDPSKIRDEPKLKKVVGTTTPPPKSASTIEPNLRSNYYYPTNKKRYLPRIKKCNDAIPDVANLIGSENWEAVEQFASDIADDTILPLKLYTSSLNGGGTNVKVSFTKDMMDSANQFEKAQKALVKAVKKKDQTASSKALESMASSLLAYRTSGRLLGPDGGGDIPSVDEIRRSACRVQGRSFELKVRERDARLASASEIKN